VIEFAAVRKPFFHLKSPPTNTGQEANVATPAKPRPNHQFTRPAPRRSRGRELGGARGREPPSRPPDR
jgi:hypothetical protein